MPKRESLSERDHRVATAAWGRGAEEGFGKGLIRGVHVSSSYCTDQLKLHPTLSGWMLQELLQLRAYELDDDAERKKLMDEVERYRTSASAGIGPFDYEIKRAEKELAALDVNAQDRQQTRDDIYAACKTHAQ